MGLAPQTRLQAPQIETGNTMNQWGFCQFLVSTPPQKRKSPIENFLATVLTTTNLQSSYCNSRLD